MLLFIIFYPHFRSFFFISLIVKVCLYVSSFCLLIIQHIILFLLQNTMVLCWKSYHIPRLKMGICKRFYIF